MPLPELNQIGSWLGEGTIPLSLIHAPAPKRVGHILYPGLTTAEEGGGGGAWLLRAWGHQSILLSATCALHV